MDSNIEYRCKKKEQELLERYFGKLAREAAVERPETIGDYTPDLPLKIEAEFRDFLAVLWKEYSAQPLVLEEEKLRQLMTESDREAIGEAYKEAATITLGERLAKSNHKDVAYYKGLLREYTAKLLMLLRHDFLEEITGRHINCKAFDDD